MSAHTPGPWFVHVVDLTYYDSIQILRADDVAIAEVYGAGLVDGAEETARLIAAAPELYEALADCLPSLIGERMSLLESHCFLDANHAPMIETLDADVQPIIAELDARIAKVRAALAKAVTP